MLIRMNHTKNISMRAGLKSDLPNVAGWCLLIGRDAQGNERRQWLPNLPKDAARRIMRNTGAAWARQYVIENGERVVLA